MGRLLPYVIALLVLAIASVTLNVLLVTGHLFGVKTKTVRVIKSPYVPSQQTQEKVP